MNEAFRELSDFCDGDALTLPLLRQKLEAGPDGIVRGDLSDEVESDTTLLHCVCYNRRVTLDIVRHLISLYPEASATRTEYGWHPLHRACNNPACPGEVVEYLADLCPGALSSPWPHAGLPLHCLVSRPTKNNIDEEVARYRLDLGLVKRLVDANPEALTNQDNQGAKTPLLCACEREDVSMDLVRLLLDPNQSVLGIRGGYSEKIPLEVLLGQYHGAEWCPPFDVVKIFIHSAPDTITTSTLHTICGSRHVSLEVVQLIIESRPDVSFLDQLDDIGNLPLHTLCLNERKDDGNLRLLPIIKYVVNAYPEAVRHMNSYGFLPLTYAIGTTLEITKLLVEEWPESVTSMALRNDPLHSAYRNGGIETVKYLFEKNPEAIYVGRPVLHLPFEGNDRDVEAKMHFLLEKDPELIRAKDPGSGNLPLHSACAMYSWDLSLIKTLFELYPDAVATRNLDGRFPLHEFLASNCFIYDMNNCEAMRALETVTFLVTQFPFSTRVADKDGMLPLHLASKFYHASIAMYLLQAYPDAIRVESPEFGLPLHCAAGRDCREPVMAVYLLSLYPGAIGMRNEKVGLPLECATSKKSFLFFVQRRYLGKTNFLLHHVLEDNDLLNPASVVRQFLANFRGNVRQIDNHGRYPLHLAVSSSRASHFVVKELLNIHPAAAEHQDKQGRVPLHLFFRHSASMENNACDQILEELLSKSSSNVNVPDHTGSLPLHCACRYGAPTSALNKMIESFPGAVRVADRNGCIPLHVACRHGSLSVEGVAHLLASDDITIQTSDNDSELPLHKACRGGHIEIVNFLLESYSPASGVRNASGSLPMYILCQKSGKADVSIMDTPDFTDTVWRLLRAHPEAVMNVV